MTEFQFFTGCDFTDRSILPLFTSETAQNNYFDSLEKVTKYGQFKGFQSPILLQEPLADCVGLSYFRFRIDDKWYYAITTEVMQDTGGKTWVHYRLDYWQTCRNQFGIRLGRGYISRSSEVEPCATPYNAKYMKRIYRKFINGSHLEDPSMIQYAPCDVIFFARRTQDNVNYVGYIKGPFNNKERQFFKDGTWSSHIQAKQGVYFNTGDIQGVWFSPSIIRSGTSVDPFSYYKDHGWRVSQSNETGLFEGNAMVTDVNDYYTDFRNVKEVMLPNSIIRNHVTNNTKTSIIKDLEGNLVFQFDYGRIYSGDLNAELSVSPTSCKWLCWIGTDRGNPEAAFTFPCSSLDYYVDSEKEYYARDREFDISTRELNNKKDLISGISGGGASAVSGAVTGALLGSAVPGVGTAIGAGAGLVAGVIGGAITSGTEAGVSNYFNPQEQEIKDRYYQNALDVLSIVGSNFINFLYDGSMNCGLFEYEADADTKVRIESDVATFGQYTSRGVSSGESYLTNGAKLKAEFVIIGDIPERWKGNIQQQIASGITVKHYGE